MPLPGSEKYSHKEWAEPSKWSTSAAARDIDRANSVPMHQILRDSFNTVVPEDLGGGSWKIYCPFSHEHADGGLDKNCRLYETHIWCFAQHGWLDPVRLIQLQRGMDSQSRAAAWILDRYGLHQARSYQERYRELQLLADGRHRNMGGSAFVVAALQSSLATLDEYASRQFDSDVVAALNEELEKLDDLLSQEDSSEEDVRQWFRTARQRLAGMMLEEGELKT